MPVDTEGLSLQDRIERGKKAEWLLGTELFDDVCDSILNEHLAAIAVSEPDQSEVREKHYLSIRAMREFRSHLTKLKTDGTFAADDLAHRKLEEEQRRAEADESESPV